MTRHPALGQALRLCSSPFAATGLGSIGSCFGVCGSGLRHKDPPCRRLPPGVGGGGHPSGPSEQPKGLPAGCGSAGAISGHLPFPSALPRLASPQVSAAAPLPWEARQVLTRDFCLNLHAQQQAVSQHSLDPPCIHGWSSGQHASGNCAAGRGLGASPTVLDKQQDGEGKKTK